MNYIISGVEYTLVVEWDDDLYEASLLPPCLPNLKGYGETMDDAIEDLEERIWEYKERKPDLTRKI